MSSNVRNSSKSLRLVRGAEAEAGAEAPGKSISGKKKIVIEVRNASLQYPVGALTRGSLKASLFGLLGSREGKRKPTYVDALRNVDLTIGEGERVGIIGSNGSGKSTLLRAMAGAYPLKSGSITVVGQIGTLLDITLGFELESTGRENIYYRGMAMGYSPQQIAKAEKEIAAFADLGEFLDLPMRTYSAGMYVRLGFAVSTQFHPDVLLIDEVFGAGDASFAQRATVRMQEIMKAAGIVIMASHDLSLVERLCSRVLWVYRGQVQCDGPPDVVLKRYAQFVAGEIPA